MEGTSPTLSCGCEKDLKPNTNHDHWAQHPGFHTMDLCYYWKPSNWLHSYYVEDLKNFKKNHIAFPPPPSKGYLEQIMLCSLNTFRDHFPANNCNQLISDFNKKLKEGEAFCLKSK